VKFFTKNKEVKCASLLGQVECQIFTQLASAYLSSTVGAMTRKEKVAWVLSQYEALGGGWFWALYLPWGGTWVASDDGETIVAKIAWSYKEKGSDVVKFDRPTFLFILDWGLGGKCDDMFVMMFLLLFSACLAACNAAHWSLHRFFSDFDRKGKGGVRQTAIGNFTLAICFTLGAVQFFNLTCANGTRTPESAPRESWGPGYGALMLYGCCFFSAVGGYLNHLLLAEEEGIYKLHEWQDLEVSAAMQLKDSHYTVKGAINALFE